MKDFIRNLKVKYFGDDLATEVKIYNGMHLIMIAALLLSTILMHVFFPTQRVFLITAATATASLFTFYIGNSTGKFELHAIIMSCIINLIFFPMIFFEYNRIYFCIPIYFIFGLIYNAFLLSEKTAFILSFIDILGYITVIYAGEMSRPLNLEIGNETFKDYMAVFVGICIVSLSCGLAVRYRMYIYRKEEEELEKLHVEAMDAYVNMDIFLINMSHEIRTPMNAIIGTIELLLDQNVNDHVKECVYNILNSSNALLSLTDEVMDLSKSGSQDITIYNARFDLSKLLMEIINMTSVRLMDSGIKFQVEIESNLPRYAYGDGPRLRQVFINILNNAVKYTKEGRILLKVFSEPIDDDEIMLKAEVEDTGIGIKSENIPHLFELYKRIDLTEDGLNAVEGTGLGLAICKEIIDKMDGEITVRSSYHVGSNFGFCVPLQEDSGERIVTLADKDSLKVLIYLSDDDECILLKKIFNTLSVESKIVENKRNFENEVIMGDHTHIFISVQQYYGNMRFLEREFKDKHLVIIAGLNESVSVNKIGFVMTRPINILGVTAVLMNKDSTYSREVIKEGKFECPDATILVVDDNLTNLNVAGGILRKYGATVHTALSGKECLDILEREKVDIVYLDYMMPEMNGIDTLMEIRKLNGGELADLPVVSLTANVVNGAKEMFLEAGFSDFISKPINIEKIEKSLKNLLPSDLIQYK
ncbi:MAG: response regulator [Lachnospiraceae bacterium]|nr:response regulator [Lachnospiraceae bacterium]